MAQNVGRKNKKLKPVEDEGVKETYLQLLEIKNRCEQQRRDFIQPENRCKRKKARRSKKKSYEARLHQLLEDEYQKSMKKVEKWLESCEHHQLNGQQGNQLSDDDGYDDYVRETQTPLLELQEDHQDDYSFDNNSDDGDVMKTMMNMTRNLEINADCEKIRQETLFRRSKLVTLKLFSKSWIRREYEEGRHK
ncbi:hypothetical protein HELRODRAFT_179226 [Helobdella robusta]|uniref:Uncharacterized protein n=1 Tax=Helobdella robusta TaxID=6412 RepID=T1FED9_HELRO|nr:hypothetical protein HELRODRAFT_179226 [Helobdella robusta]ESN95458.1 hypothetical protein HELRODRAFT_179226 [Helobdella robusta]